MIGKRFKTASGKIFTVVNKHKRKERKSIVYDYTIQDQEGNIFEQSAKQFENTIRNSIII